MEKCSNCGREFEGRFCPDCGMPAYKTCPDCGKRLDNGAAFCSDCGYNFTNKNEATDNCGTQAANRRGRSYLSEPIAPMPVERLSRKERKWLNIKKLLSAYRIMITADKCSTAAAWGVIVSVVFTMVFFPSQSYIYIPAGTVGMYLLALFLETVFVVVLSLPLICIARSRSKIKKEHKDTEFVKKETEITGVQYVIYRIVGVTLFLMPTIEQASIISLRNTESHSDLVLLFLVISAVKIVLAVVFYAEVVRMRAVLNLRCDGDYDTVKRGMEIGVREETERVEAYANYREQMRRYKVDKKRVTNGLRPKTDAEHNRDRTRITWFKRGSAIAAAVAVVAVAVGVISGIDPNYAAKAADIMLGDYEAQVIRVVGEEPHEKSGNTYHWYGKKARKIKNEIEKLNEKAFGSTASEKDVEQAMEKTERLEEKLDKLGGYKHLSVTFVENELGVREAIEVKYDAKEQPDSVSDSKKINSAKLSGSVDFKVATTEGGETIYSPDKSSSAKQTATATVEYEDGSYVCKKVYVSIFDGENRIAIWNIYWLSDPIKTTYNVTSSSSRDGTMTISF